MPAKRARDEAGSSAPFPKKARGSFTAKPGKLPVGAWRMKAARTQRDKIERVKIEKKYTKMKTQKQQQERQERQERRQQQEQQQKIEAQGRDTEEKEEVTGGAAEDGHIHPDRRARIDDDDAGTAGDGWKRGGTEAEPTDTAPTRQKARQKQKKDGRGYKKELAEAERKQQEAEERRQERERQEKERARRAAERKRHSRAVHKARTPGRDGQRRLGRESVVLLDKVKKLVGG